MKMMTTMRTTMIRMVRMRRRRRRSACGVLLSARSLLKVGRRGEGCGGATSLKLPLSRKKKLKPETLNPKP